MSETLEPHADLNLPLIVPIHGSWHDEVVFEPLQMELEFAGYHTLAPRLPTDEPDMTFDDCAKVAADQIKSKVADLNEMGYFPDVVLLPWSRAGNYGDRVDKIVRVDHIIYAAATFEPATYSAIAPANMLPLPPRNVNPKFRAGIKYISDTLTEFDPELAPDVFYHDCTSTTQSEAKTRLRPHRRSIDEPYLDHWRQDLKRDYIIHTGDRAVNPSWSEAFCKNILGIEPEYIGGGHASFLARPREYAGLVIKLIQRNAHDSSELEASETLEASPGLFWPPEQSTIGWR
jgi:hypothetical protein